jgi:hypothetical protein
MHKLLKLVETHMLLARIVCGLLSISMVIVIILGFLNLIPGLLFYIVAILYALSLILLVIIGIRNLFDRILHIIMTIISLLICSGVITEIVHLIFKSIYISVYFGVTSFFVFSYLYDIFFRKYSEQTHVYIGFIPIEMDSTTRTLLRTIAQSSVYVSSACNVMRIALLIIFVFNSQYSFIVENLRNLPISEAIVTSLAFEKLIKGRYSKLDTKVIR